MCQREPWAGACREGECCDDPPLPPPSLCVQCTLSQLPAVCKFVPGDVLHLDFEKVGWETWLPPTHPPRRQQECKKRQNIAGIAPVFVIKYLLSTCRVNHSTLAKSLHCAKAYFPNCCLHSSPIYWIWFGPTQPGGPQEVKKDKTLLSRHCHNVYFRNICVRQHTIPYKPYIFREDMVLVPYQCHHILIWWSSNDHMMVLAPSYHQQVINANCWWWWSDWHSRHSLSLCPLPQPVSVLCINCWVEPSLLLSCSSQISQFLGWIKYPRQSKSCELYYLT